MSIATMLKSTQSSEVGAPGTWQRLAASQHGVLSRRQAERSGLTRGRINGLMRRGEWAVVYPGVYRSTAAPSAWPQALMAAALWAGPGAAISHQAAAALWGLEGFWRSRVEVSGVGVQAPPRGVTLFRVRRLDRADITVRQGIPVTAVARTLLDLAGVVPGRVLERALDEALRRRMVAANEVRWCLDRNGRFGRRGVGALQALLEERDGQAANDSALETDAAALFRAERLPAPIRNYDVIENDCFLARVDLAWPRQRVAVQAHGGVHRQPRNWERDQVVESQLAAAGWRVLKVTRRMLDGAPSDAAALVRQALADRSKRR